MKQVLEHFSAQKVAPGETDGIKLKDAEGHDMSEVCCVITVTARKRTKRYIISYLSISISVFLYICIYIYILVPYSTDEDPLLCFVALCIAMISFKEFVIHRSSHQYCRSCH